MFELFFQHTEICSPAALLPSLFLGSSRLLILLAFFVSDELCVCVAVNQDFVFVCDFYHVAYDVSGVHLLAFTLLEVH